jgi:hypothetical protein
MGHRGLIRRSLTAWLTAQEDEAVTEQTSEQVGMVLGTEDSTPLTFWVGVDPESYSSWTTRCSSRRRCRGTSP